MRRIHRPFALHFALLCAAAGCATHGQRDATQKPDAAQAPRDERLSLPSFGISLPTPHGWTARAERLGSIGSLLLASWMRPGAGEDADAAIVLVLADRTSFAELPSHVQAEAGPTVDGKPSLKLTRATPPTTRRRNEAGLWGLDDGLVEGYRLEGHNFYFFLSLTAKRPVESDRETIRAMVSGWRWLTPAPAHEALALSGQLERVWYDAELWFDVPYPFVNNPFRGAFYDPFTLNESESDEDDNAHFEVAELKGARDAGAARRAARDTPTYYETHGWDFAWHRVAREPDVQVGVSAPTPPDSEGTMWMHKAIVARAADGRYFRILFTVGGKDLRVMKAYEAIADDVGRSITTVAPPGASR
jgi:hypothetical protein